MSIPQRDQQPDKRREFLVDELRCLWLQLREAQRDIEAIGGGLRCGAVNPDEAVGILHGCDLPALLGPRERIA